MDNKEVMIIGLDIHNFVKKLCNQFLCSSPDMTDGEKKAYRLGINNTLSFLEQVLCDMIADEHNDYHNIAINIPGLNVLTEFATVEEISELQLNNV